MCCDALQFPFSFFFLVVCLFLSFCLIIYVILASCANLETCICWRLARSWSCVLFVCLLSHGVSYGVGHHVPYLP